MTFPMSQATHGSGRGALEARPCTQKKHCWEPKFKKKHGQSQQFQPKNPNTNPKSTVLTVIIKLVFQQNKRQMPPMVHFFQHGGKCSKVLCCDSMTRQCPVLEHVFSNSNEDEICRVFSAKDIQHLGRARCLFSRSHDWSSLLHIKTVKCHLVSWDLLPSHELCYVAAG